MAEEQKRQPDINAIWEKVKIETFDRIPFRANVMDAFHAATAITIDGDILVVGFGPAQFHMSGLLRTPDTKNAAEAVLFEMAKRRIEMEVIDGTTVEDWERVKQRKTLSQQSQLVEAHQRMESRSTKGSFDDLREELLKRHAAFEGRQFPHVKAKFLLDILPLLAESEKNLRSDPKFVEDTYNRELARTYDRIASWVDMSSAHIALELERYKKETGSQ